MRTTLFIVLVFCFANMTAQIKFTPDTVRGITLSELMEHKATIESENEEKPFISKEQMPEFIGGKEAFQKFVDKNLKYKKEYRADTLVTEAIVRFVVKKDGSIADPKILKGEGTTFAKNVLKAVGKMPKWKPGKPGGLAMPVYYTVRFWYDGKKSKVMMQYPVYYNASTGELKVLD